MKMNVDFPCELCGEKTRSLAFAKPEHFKHVMVTIRCKGCESVSTFKVTKPKGAAPKLAINFEVVKLVRSAKWMKKVTANDETQFRVGW